jgi:hypothetical protein
MGAYAQLADHATFISSDQSDIEPSPLAKACGYGYRDSDETPVPVSDWLGSP